MSDKEKKPHEMEPQVQNQLDQHLVEDAPNRRDQLDTVDVSQKIEETQEESAFATGDRTPMSLELKKKETSIPVELPKFLDAGATVDRLKKISLPKVEPSKKVSRNRRQRSTWFRTQLPNVRKQY